MTAQPPLPRMSETPKQERAERPERPEPRPERPEHHEPAARHVDVDEDYDDEGEEAKPTAAKPERESPRNAPTNGVPHAATPVEQKS